MSRPCIRAPAITAICCLAGSIGSQGKSFVSPAANATARGDTSSSIFGRFPSQRIQFLDSGWAGKGSRGFSQISFRHDGPMQYRASNGMGRTWTSVKLTMSEVVTLNRSGVFSKNQLLNKKLVFSGKLSFPTVSGYRTKPSKFQLGRLHQSGDTHQSA